ncbi:hypothetical protein D9756_001881 [Leucocoprinus leucothites]|uniref:Uncharacterized protein n=1 Tax=Leucocoprinus leucothites TaxID=201217 RepID=A0A8H5LI34_9AGAR|nr:hypothetical protein D9756_001881 [Leucoagaricus leucothites]
MTNATSVPGIIRGILLTVVTIINLASTTIMCLALTFGSGGRFQSVLMGFNGFACLLPAAYWLHKIVFEGEYPFVRSISIFGLLTLIGFANVITVLVRNDQQDGMALVQDFAMLDHPGRIAKASIALAMVSAFFSLSGFMVAQTGYMSQKVSQNTQPDIPLRNISTEQKDGQLSRFPSTASSTTLVSHAVPSSKEQAIPLEKHYSGRQY